MTLREDLKGSEMTLIQLRAWMARREVTDLTRLPPERVLSGELGVTRGELRKALSALEREGAIWRHVGKGTFIGSRPLEDVMDLSEVEHRTNPAEVMRTRLILEPALARDAALHATRQDVAEMAACMTRARNAETWRRYEAQDNALHRAVAKAAANTLTLALFDALNTVRRGVVCAVAGRFRQPAARPPLLPRARGDRRGDPQPRPRRRGGRDAPAPEERRGKVARAFVKAVAALLLTRH